MDLDVDRTIDQWTYRNSMDTVEEFEGSVYMCERLPESPTNILYMLCPNGPSQEYPYPAEYMPSDPHLVDVPFPAESSANVPTSSDMAEEQDTRTVSVKARRPYVRRKKGSEPENKGENPSRKATSASSPLARQVANPRKPASPRKRASPRKPPTQVLKASSTPNVSSPLREEIG